MFKLLIYVVLFYAAYKLFIGDRLNAPQNDEPSEPEDDYVDYEEVD